MTDTRTFYSRVEMVAHLIPIMRMKFAGHDVGLYRADLIVEGKIIVEIKALSSLCDENKSQLINYLKATGLEVGLLLNFGPSPEVKRVVFSKK